MRTSTFIGFPFPFFGRIRLKEMFIQIEFLTFVSVRFFCGGNVMILPLFAGQDKPHVPREQDRERR